LYQGTYKSFLVQEDEHFCTVCRYVERNAWRTNLVPSAEQWRWGGLAQSMNHLGVEETVELSDVARASATELGGIGQRGADGGGTGLVADFGRSRASFRPERMAAEHGETMGAGVYVATSWAAAEAVNTCVTQDEQSETIGRIPFTLSPFPTSLLSP